MLFLVVNIWKGKALFLSFLYQHHIISLWIFIFHLWYKYSNRGVQPFGVSVTHWKKKSCLGPHVKYIATHNHKKIS